MVLKILIWTIHHYIREYVECNDVVYMTTSHYIMKFELLTLSFSIWSSQTMSRSSIIFSCFNVQCRIFLLLTSFLGCTSCYKDTFAQLHRKKGREFMFICRHIVETIPRLVRGCFQAVSKATRILDWSKSPVVKPQWFKIPDLVH